MVEYKSDRVSKITDYVEALKAGEQQELLEALERKALMEEAARLNKSVRKNSVSMKEICEVVNDVRRKRKRKWNPTALYLDANIYITLILSRKLDELVRWSKDDAIEIYIYRELIDELADVIKRDKIKKHLTIQASSYLKFIRSVCSEISIDKRFDRAPDLKDNYLFDLAYTVKSHYLVTADRPLLNMKQVNKIKVISLNQFRKLTG